MCIRCYELYNLEVIFVLFEYMFVKIWLKSRCFNKYCKIKMLMINVGLNWKC